MLRELRIRNFAIIEDLLLHFQEGLTIFTGETGAGKSILVDAVDLLVGGRASTDQIRTGSNEAVLEAAFTAYPPHPVINQLKEMGLLTHEDEEIIIRRIISRSGKGRIYLNGGLIPLGLLQQLGEGLVDIHGQHEHQSLLKPDQQLELLDAYGRLVPIREEYHRHYARFLTLKDEQQELKRLEQDRAALEDLLRFQQQEIRSARLKPGEEEDLEQERRLLSHAEHLTRQSSEAYEVLYEADGSILSQLARLTLRIHELNQIDPRLTEAAEMTEAADANLREVAERLRAYRDQIQYDPHRLEEINDHLHLIGRLKKKYGPTVEEVLRTLEKAEEDLKGLSTREERLQMVEDELSKEQKRVRELAQKLTQGRDRVAGLLSREMETELKPLRMGRTAFEARVKPLNDEEGLNPTGADRVEFLIAPNPGEEARLMNRIASGGELSRIMLALKVILSDVDRVPTLVFDEVDAGIGSAVANAVGQRLRALSRRRQVFCITHLPQIAAYATTHISVEKRVDAGRTTTRASHLVGREQVEEIARMLGGREITQTALKHAREMLGVEKVKG